ncbi:MAG: hypothetical protein ACREUB_07615 [Burkholderiales bacterium]
MRATKWTAMVVSAVVLLAAGCRGAVPVYNVTNAPVAASKTASLDDVGKAIVRAGVTLGWQMKETKPGHVLGTLYLRKHVAVVDVNYSATSYSIQYKDSTELNYDGQNIHPNYNGWIQNLDKAIRAQLSTL